MYLEDHAFSLRLEFEDHAEDEPFLPAKLLSRIGRRNSA